MNINQINTTYKITLDFLIEAKIKKAFENIKLMIDELQLGNFTDKYLELEQNYRYLLNYYINGYEDHERKVVYNKLISRAFILSSDLREELLFRNSTNFEYTQQRYFPHTKHYISSSELLISLQYYHSHTALIKNLEDTHAVELDRLRSNYETALVELFKVYWLNSYFSEDEVSIFNQIMKNENSDNLEKQIIISAITLNLWRKFDEKKLMLLVDCCQSTQPEIQQRALVGLCFILARYNRFLTFFPTLRNRLVLMSDNNQLVEYFKNIIIQIIATAETDKISKKLREEILPEIMKISPLLKDKMEAENLLKSDEWGEENPEWADFMEDSGISDKLQELTDLQMEGADVYMSTFSMLKSFPFFNEISNWFLPFDSRFSVVKDLFDNEDTSILNAFIGNNAMCNSDKYSFCLSILQMPEQQRGMLKKSFKMESEQLEEMVKDEALLNPGLFAKNLSKQYIQDLFRFFKLFPQKLDFEDMFDTALNLHQTFLFDILSANSDLKKNITEYYFSKNHYLQSIELFEEIIKEDSKPNALLFQKLGYSYQQSSQLLKALDIYQKADLIQPDHLWTIRKIALCNRLCGDYEKALQYYQHADYIKPDQETTLLQIANCLVQLGKHKEALKIYFKLDAEKDENKKVWKAISWCAFVTGNFAQAGYYSEKLLENFPDFQDYINAGHIEWCKGRTSDALNYYAKSLTHFENNIQEFYSIMLQDKPHLIANGIDENDFPLLLDELSYKLDL